MSGLRSSLRSATTSVTTSIVFTDLVGSTELASRIGPVVAEEVRATHFGLLRDALVITAGSEVKNLGDGLMVVFPSLSAALDGAVAMQQTIELHNRRASVPLGVRIGMSSGDAYEDQGDYFGEPVVEAARLCAKATGGQIVTTEMVRMLARRSGHRFATLGPMDLKGLPEPIEAFEVMWEPVKAVALVPLPSRLEPMPATGVVGRALERDRLLTTLKAAFSGDGHRVALLSGDAGIGTTTLAGEVAQRAHAGGATVLYGRCEELGLPNASDDALLTLDEGHLRELSWSQARPSAGRWACTWPGWPSCSTIRTTPSGCSSARTLSSALLGRRSSEPGTRLSGPASSAGKAPRQP